MKLFSTRNSENVVSFREAVKNCVPEDGGLYVPATDENLRSWILYMDENTSFQSICGTLTSALLKEELSPVISERIAAPVFKFTPDIVPLSENMSLLRLYHGESGSHKDYGLSFLASYLEHVLTMEDSNALVLAATTGSLGAGIAKAFKGKKRIKAILLYPQNNVFGIPEESLIENGGNILPLGVSGSIAECHELIRDIYKDRDFVRKNHLTLANTVNIGRLLPQAFFYMYAFTRLKKNVSGDIFYAQAAGNYGNLVAGLYAWRCSLPVSGFITESTSALTTNIGGECVFTDSMVPVKRRDESDPSDPSNLERLEQVFAAGSSLMKSLVFPQKVNVDKIPDVISEFYREKGLFIDSSTATACLAARNILPDIVEDEGHIVLIQKDHPSREAEKLRLICGKAPEIPESLRFIYEQNKNITSIGCNSKELAEIIAKLS